MAFLTYQQTFTSNGVYAVSELNNSYIVQASASGTVPGSVLCDAGGNVFPDYPNSVFVGSPLLIKGTAHINIVLGVDESSATATILYCENVSVPAVQTAVLTDSMQFFTTVSVPSTVVLTPSSVSPVISYAGPGASAAMDGVETVALNTVGSSTILGNFSGTLFIGTNDTDSIGQTVTCVAYPN